MTPKEKAKELVEKYIPLSSNFDEKYGWKDDITRAKKCALIAVDEISDAIDWHDFESPNKQWNYWREVKTEIEKVLLSDKKCNFYKIKGIKDYAREIDLQLVPSLKVFKFYCGELYYAFAAKTKELAVEEFTEQIGYQFTVCEEIPESEWDKKIINIWEDNDMSKKPYKQSIREVMCGTEPQMIFTNDTASF